ncbi:hypothetical protein JCM10212_000157, partial [Sporobolomyces blumeae]
MRDSDAAVSASSVFVVPDGPSEDFVNFTAGRFSEESSQDFDDLGFVNREMTDDESHRFALCSVLADVPGIEDYVDYEPHNPLLDQDEDSSMADLTKGKAIEALNELVERFSDVIVDELPDRLPPFRPINHEVDVDPDFAFQARPIPLPARYEQQWTAHLRKFVETGYWSPAALDSACAMFAVPKHDKTKARFVINLKPRNSATRRRVSPIPEMRQARYHVAAKKVRSKLDFKSAYEQIRVSPDSVPKTGFVTKSGTFVSRVMQQGDCNAPDTIHRVCYLMFSKAIGRFLEVFYDDVFVFSDSYRSHLRHLEIVFTTLRHYRFFLARDKVSFMEESIEALGCVIDDSGISVDPSKWESVRNWPTPRNPKDVLRFMGSVQWMADHLPRLSEIAAPITRLTGKVNWDWTPACEAAFEIIKSLVPQTLRTLDLRAIDDGSERLFLFTDASIFGCGGWLGQGSSRTTARPIRFVSAKFNSAQLNYSTTDQELLAVLHCCVKMADHLRGVHFTVVSDHMPLRTYWDQDLKLTRRHVRTWETLAEFDFDWEFISGKDNALADSLSRLAELDGQADGPVLPVAQEPVPASDDPEPFASEPSPRMRLAMAALFCAISATSSSFSSTSTTAADRALTTFSDAFTQGVREALKTDTLGKKILAAPSSYPGFVVRGNLIYVKDDEAARLVVPRGRFYPEEGAPRRRSSRRSSGPGTSRSGTLVTDLLSKAVVLLPLASTATASEVADAFFDVVYRRFGLPDAVVSDRDPKFTSAFWRALCAKLGISLNMSTAAHPQTDGRSEVT